MGAPLAAPLVEETTKALGVLLLFWFLRAEFDNVRDGFVYGALVGVGFNLLEAPLYVAQGFAEDGVAPWGLQMGARYALLGLGGHAMFTGIFGAFLGVLLMALLQNAMIIAGINPFGQLIVVGIVLLISVGLDQFARARSRA